MLKQRIITALLLAPLVLLITIYGNKVQFAGLVAVLHVFINFEWFRMNHVPFTLNIILSTVLTALVAVFVLFNGFLVDELWLLTTIVCVWLPAVLWLKNRHWGQTDGQPHVMKLFLGLLGALVFAYALNMIHSFERGYIWTLMLFGLIWVADIGAYISGKLFGRHKLAPSISPGKTWEGLLGGLLLTAIYTYIVSYFVNFNLTMALILFPVIAAFSVVGDLTASLAKRQAQMKDSSNFLPGHGGFVDRFDSMIAAAPLFLVVVGWVQ